MNLGAELLLNLWVYLALAVAAVAGAIALSWRSDAWLPLQRLRPGQWSGGEVVLCFLLQFGPLLVLSALDEADFFFYIFDQQVSRVRQFNLLSPLTLALLFALYFTLTYRISGTRPQQVGLTLARWRANVRLGLVAFVSATPVVLCVYLLALAFFHHAPHPFEELARENLRPFEWVFIAFSAIVLPSLTEEWLFRGLLQGWLRRATPIGHLVVAMIALSEGSAPFVTSYLKHQEKPETPILWESLVFAGVVVGVYLTATMRLWWPVFRRGLQHFAEPSDANGVEVVIRQELLEGQTPVIIPQGPRWEAFKRANASLAILGSATLFALMHEAWPSAIALLPFGLVLGWLAYRTQSLIPGIVVHALFNAVAYGVLFFSAAAP